MDFEADNLYSLSYLGLEEITGSDEESKEDIIGKLPPEISFIILKYLDGESLMNASRVSKHWLHLCMSDGTLKARVQLQLHKATFHSPYTSTEEDLLIGCMYFSLRHLLLQALKSVLNNASQVIRKR